MGDKLEELGGGTFACFDDCSICYRVICCDSTQLHYVDTAARYKLYGRRENVAAASQCCGLCILCYDTEVEERLNAKLGGTPDYNRKCCCYYCCGSCRQCMFLRAVQTLENQGTLGAPQSEEMSK